MNVLRGQNRLVLGGSLHWIFHTEDVAFFDRKKTISGITRKEQRKLYDERRKVVLPQHGISLVVISYNDFEYNKKKRIIRNKTNDLKVVFPQILN